MCSSRKYPYPPPITEGNGNSEGRGGGGLKGGDFRGGGGGLLTESLLPGRLSKIAELFNT